MRAYRELTVARSLFLAVSSTCDEAITTSRYNVVCGIAVCTNTAEEDLEVKSSRDTITNNGEQPRRFPAGQVPGHDADVRRQAADGRGRPVGPDPAGERPEEPAPEQTGRIPEGRRRIALFRQRRHVDGPRGPGPGGEGGTRVWEHGVENEHQSRGGHRDDADARVFRARSVDVRRRGRHRVPVPPGGGRRAEAVSVGADLRADCGADRLRAGRARGRDRRRRGPRAVGQVPQLPAAAAAAARRQRRRRGRDRRRRPVRVPPGFLPGHALAHLLRRRCGAGEPGRVRPGPGRQAIRREEPVVPLALGVGRRLAGNCFSPRGVCISMRATSVRTLCCRLGPSTHRLAVFRPSFANE